MKYSVSLLAILAAAGVLWSPVEVHGQNKDIVALQRDVADVTRRLEAFQKNQGERMDALGALLKQAAEANHALSMELRVMQQNLQASMQKSIAEQQRGVSEPMAAVRSAVDTLGQDTVAIRSDLAALNTKVGKIETMLTDIQAAVRTLNAPPAAPPPSASDAANTLFSSAERDFLGGRNDLALEAYKQFWQLYPTSPNAAPALLKIGQIYDRVMQYKDARDAFDTILERFPDSTTTPEAAFWKAEMLNKENDFAAAATEYENFAAKYPAHLNAATAKVKAATLRAAKGGKGATKGNTKGKNGK